MFFCITESSWVNIVICVNKCRNNLCAKKEKTTIDMARRKHVIHLWSQQEGKSFLQHGHRSWVFQSPHEVRENQISRQISWVLYVWYLHPQRSFLAFSYIDDDPGWCILGHCSRRMCLAIEMETFLWEKKTTLKSNSELMSVSVPKAQQISSE